VACLSEPPIRMDTVTPCDRVLADCPAQHADQRAQHSGQPSASAGAGYRGVPAQHSPVRVWPRALVSRPRKHRSLLRVGPPLQSDLREGDGEGEGKVVLAFKYLSRNTSVGIATGHGLDAPGSMTSGVRLFSFP
jgi:hypothetical protein